MESLWIDLHDGCVIWMSSLIWLVQVLIYPNFRFIPEAEFPRFHKQHCDRIAIFVAPMMVQPFAAAMVLLSGTRPQEWMLHASSIFLIYLITALFSAPEHNRLRAQKNPRSIERLIATNWGRTLLWTGQLGLILVRRSTG